MYVPAVKPDIVVLAVEPVMAPGLIVQFPAGKPLNTTLPVAVEQVGCVMVPIVGSVGVALLVSVTSSYVLQVPLTIVQRNTAGVPVVTPVTVEVAEFMLVIVAVPLCTVHVPVPTKAAFPARVKLPLLHCAWSAPASAIVGTSYTVTVSVSEFVQLPLVTV